jgi:hypothetical protein
MIDAAGADAADLCCRPALSGTLARALTVHPSASSRPLLTEGRCIHPPTERCQSGH